MMPVVINLCGRTGNIVRPWAEAGWTCYCVDIAHSIRRDRVQGNITYTWGDVRSWCPPDGTFPAIILAESPCTHLAVSGARDFGRKHWPMLRDGMDLFMACLQAARWAGCPYALENPVGRISGIHHPATHTFDPCDYGGYLDPPGDAYTKKTCLWTGGGFIMPEPRPVFPVEGSRMHGMTPSDDRADLRSETPMGFARAVYEANHEHVAAHQEAAR